MNLRRVTGIAVATACVSISLVAGGGASYAEGTDVVIGEGSVTDYQNILGASLSDATATGTYAAVAVDGSCNSSATKPAARADTSSPTKQTIFAVVKLSCVNGSMTDSWELQRHRWYGWSGLGSISGGGSGTFSWRGEVAVHCKAGTWSYRVKAQKYHTKSFRHTCVDPNNPTYIDLG